MRAARIMAAPLLSAALRGARAFGTAGETGTGTGLGAASGPGVSGGGPWGGPGGAACGLLRPRGLPAAPRAPCSPPPAALLPLLPLKLSPFPAALCRRAAPLGPMPNEEIDVSKLEALEKYRSFTRYFRQAEQEGRKARWWKTYRQYASPEPGTRRRALRLCG